MNKTRKTVSRITNRALSKVKQFYYNGVHAYCTPAEYLCLCWYFNLEPDKYFQDRVSDGDSRPYNVYLKVDSQLANSFTKHPKAMTNTLMQ